MNNVRKMNPDSAILQQSEGHWQRYLAFVLWKLADGKSVSITTKDLEEFAKTDRNYILVHGHYDSIEFKLVTPAEAELLAAHDAQQMRGQA